MSANTCVSLLGAIAGAFIFAFPAHGAHAASRVSFVNQRVFILLELTITPEGRTEEASRVIGRNVNPSGSVETTIPTDAPCVYDIRGTYDDGSYVESLGVDLCKLRKVRLGD